jgi:hypothetical protein
MNCSKEIYTIGGKLRRIVRSTSVFGDVVRFPKGRIEVSSGVHNEKSGCNSSGIILMRITVKRIEVTKPISAGFAVFSVNRF